MPGQHKINSLGQQQVEQVGPMSQAYFPTVRHGLCMPTTTHGIPAARAPSMVCDVHWYLGVPAA